MEDVKQNGSGFGKEFRGARRLHR
ncbi:uncharacterized protein G2W53_001103 [Senna tora]|uniref:Uncharacterized protein n=1 Tax=Senna tora TaxID=362788 RepID=A0A834XJ26_9FABA|nr:uncharacterized protein G2W53_001103 [Senna tora]